MQRKLVIDKDALEAVTDDVATVLLKNGCTLIHWPKNDKLIGIFRIGSPDPFASFHSIIPTPMDDFSHMFHTPATDDEVVAMVRQQLARYECALLPGDYAGGKILTLCRKVNGQWAALAQIKELGQQILYRGASGSIPDAPANTQRVQ